MTRCLTRFECGSIQSYIFASNRLREAIGGSFLVKEAIEGTLYRTLNALFPDKTSVEWEAAERLQILDDASLQVEVLYSGGGNALVVCLDQDIAIHLTSYLSSQLVALAPGLPLLAVHADFDESKLGDLGVALEQTEQALEKLKREARFGVRREGLGVTRACATTGQVAAFGLRNPDKDVSDDQKLLEWVSASAAARRQAADQAEAQLTKEYGKSGYEFPSDLDDIGGRKEVDNHIAVVHIDGNRIGSRLMGITKQQGLDNQTLAQQLRVFSKSVKTAADQALKQLVDELAGAIPRLKTLENGLDIKIGQSGADYMPFRPLIYGGDDLTFVCEGRIGLALAARYLKIFAQLSDSLKNKFAACAGVVIARNHFPLARAYRLSEELCGTAKKRARENDERSRGSWLDFHIIYSGITGQLEQMRPENEDTSNLLANTIPYWRPWQVVSGIAEDRDRHNWQNFQDIAVNYFGADTIKSDQSTDNEQQKIWPRSWVKELREVLLQGEVATTRFLSQAASRGYKLPDSIIGTSLGKNGWANGNTPFYDVVEALDFYLELEVQT